MHHSEDDTPDDLIAEARAERRYLNQLMRHPDPRDPDHPEQPEDEPPTGARTMMTNQAQIRAAFWEAHPNLPRRRYRYSWNPRDKTAELVFPIDTRCAFSDFLDYLERDGQITEALANRATL